MRLLPILVLSSTLACAGSFFWTIGPGSAEERPTEAAVIEQARVAAEAGDDAALAAIAANDAFDVWWIVEGLCQTGAHDAAAALAKQGGGDAEALARYVAAVRKGAPDGALRKLHADVRAAADAETWKQVVEQTTPLMAGLEKESMPSVTRIRILAERGYAARQLGDAAAARAAYLAAREQAAALGWTAEASYRANQAARVGFAIAQAREARGELAEARDLYAALADEFLDAGMPALRGIVLAAKGNVERTMGAYAEALASLRAARTVLHENGLSLPAAQTLVDMGRTLIRLGKYGEAVTHCTDGLAEYGGLEEPADPVAAQALARARADAHLALGNAHYWSSRYVEALASYDAAEKLLAEDGESNRRLMARVETGRGMVLQQQGAYEEARRRHQRAIDLYKGLASPVEEAQSHSNLAVTLGSLGEYDQALLSLREALEILQKHPNEPVEAEVQERLGNLHQWLGDARRAMAYHEKARDMWKALPCSIGMGRVLANMGITRMAEGRYTDALALYEQALRVQEANPNADNRATLLMNSGDALDAVGRYEEAAARYTEAAEVFDGIGDKAGELTAKANLGEVLQHTGKHDEGRKRLKRAARDAQRAGAGPVVIAARVMLARLELDAGENEDAVEEAERALEQLEARAFKGLGDEHGATARARHGTVYKVGAVAAQRAGDPEMLFTFLDRGRAGQFLDNLDKRTWIRWQDERVPEGLRAAERRAAEAVLAARKALGEAQASGDAEAIADAKQQFQAAVDAEALAADNIQAWRKGDAGSYARGKSLEEVRENLGESEALVVYGVFSEDRGPVDRRIDVALAMVITSKDVSIVDLGRANDVRETCRVLSDGHAASELMVRGTNRKSAKTEVDWEGEVGRVRKKLVEPLGLKDDVKRVIVCPDDVLCYVPFGPLFARPVVYTPSGSAHVLLKAHDKKAGKGKGILALGRPDYSTVSDAARTFYYDDAPLDDLAHTEDEAKAIGTVRLIGKEASEHGLRTALAEASDRLRAIHFACHGRADKARPMLSALALAAAGEDDGFLTAREIRRMSMPADLVVLSACDTSRGEIVGGEGIRGLARSFMFAGAPRVLCALWKVPDESTSVLMTEFYRLWNPPDGSPGVPAAEALAQAQEHVRAQKKEWQDPAHWAAWVLWGLPDG